MWHDNILGTIGSTPLVRLNRVSRGLPCAIVAKVEMLNPGGSVKDRIGIAMIRAAEADGRLKPGGTVIECTSGNTGAGVALAAIALGYRCVFTTTDKQSKEKIDVLRALGAEVHVSPTHVEPDDPRSYYSVARRLATEIPNSFHLNQYDNPANTEAHYLTTGPELWADTDGRITHFIAGAGTGGTISGATRYLKERNPDIKAIGVDPFGSVYYKYFHTGEFDAAEIYPYLTEGVGEDILAGNMDFSLVDDYVRVSDRDAMQMTRRLAREEGLFVGQSSGMAAAGALEWIRTNSGSLAPENVVVVLLPDSGFRYLSKTYDDNWMRGHGFLESRSGVTAGNVVELRRARRAVQFVDPESTLEEAILRMSSHGISQLPVMGADGIVGSLTETAILNHLIENPDARKEPVRQVMTNPLPVVPESTGIIELSEYLETELGAVLVRRPDNGYDIITKSDVIGVLALSERPSRNGNNTNNEHS